MKKQYLYLILSLLCMALIFILSAQDAVTSGALSNKVKDTVNEHTGFSFSNETMRSIAHFLLFLLLGIFVSLWMKEQSIAYFLKPVIVSFFICAIYAVTDEIHQEFFVEGRAFELIDLAKDWSGSLLGCIAVRLGAIREEK